MVTAAKVDDFIEILLNNEFNISNEVDVDGDDSNGDDSEAEGTHGRVLSCQTCLPNMFAVPALGPQALKKGVAVFALDKINES